VIHVYTARASTPLPEGAGPTLRLDRARTLRALGRPAEAERCLAGIWDTNVEALLLRGDLLQDQKNWHESSRCYRQVLERLAPAAPPDREAVSRKVHAYDGLAFNAREVRSFHEVTGIYREAMNDVPLARAHFHFQLGRHYHHGGRPGEARAELQEAVRLDPATFAAQAQPLLADLDVRTPGCLLRWR
jgi:tetratricopeptide (TPR) repeat protein